MTLQLAAPHIVAAGHLAHPPLPSQLPFWPQVVGSELSHSLSGSVPIEMGWQRPEDWPVLSLEQAEHFPRQLDSQQTPSTHDWLKHSIPILQAAPTFFCAVQRFVEGSQ